MSDHADLVLDWLAKRLASHAARTPFLLGLSGLQGSGKSTLAARLVARAAERGIDAVTLSLDDVYRTRAERIELARTVHPLLATRGVPGTHDIALLHRTLDALATATPQTPAPVPVFDKGIDDRLPPTHWHRVDRAPRVIVLEGWCIGVPPQRRDALQSPINTLERDEDADLHWRHHVNTALATDYAALWTRLDALVVLQAPSFDIVRTWRNEQEDTLRRAGAPQAMTPSALDRFIAHYERVSRHALATLPRLADLLIALDATRASR